PNTTMDQAPGTSGKRLQRDNRVMECVERHALLERYYKATERLVELTQELARVARSCDRDTWQRARKKCDEATRRCVALRKQLAEHMRNHCGLGATRSAGA